MNVMIAKANKHLNYLKIDKKLALLMTLELFWK